MKSLGMIKLIAIVAVMLLTAYPVAELTRLIIHDIQLVIYAESTGAALIWITPFNDIPNQDTFYIELGLIWGFYLVIPFMLNLLIDLVYKMGVRNGVAGERYRRQH